MAAYFYDGMHLSVVCLIQMDGWKKKEMDG